MSDVLSIWMATYREFDSVWATVQGLRASHGDGFGVGVVDNSPEGDRNAAACCRAAGGRYFHRPDLWGTSAPRDFCFRVSRTPWTMVVDSHVQLEAGAVRAAVEYAEAHPASKDIVSGPLVYDDGISFTTHWRPAFEGALWGEWDGDERFRQAWFGHPPRSPSVTATPTTPRRPLRDEAAALPPFEIRMFGLGLFMMRTAAWPGFNPYFAGFGSEEGYIHEKVRRLGGRAVCHPGIRWRHRFRAAGGTATTVGQDSGAPPPYPTVPDSNVRNLVLGHRELGLDPTRVQTDFGIKASPRRWAEIVAEAERLMPTPGVLTTVPPKLKVLGVWYSNNSAPPKLLKASLDSIAKAQANSRHDVRVVTCPWQPVAGNPFPEVLAAYKDGPGHLNIVRQQRQCLDAAPTRPDVVMFLEHDVLYPPGHFDRLADALAANPDAPVAVNLDYIGLNATGWLRNVAGHEPLHQIAVRYDAAVANLDRAEADCRRQGWAYLEPDSAADRRVTPECAEFEPGMWVGQLPSKLPPGVAAVLNLTEGLPQPWPAGVIHEQETIRDADPAPPLPWLAGVVSLVGKWRAAGKDVLIHCQGGVSRSGLVACAYLIQTRGMTREQALSAIREVRPQVAPRPAFWALLAEYQATLGPRTWRNPRDSWVRLPAGGVAPAVHVNHEGGRFTSHGEVVYERSSTLPPAHAYWGDWRAYWPGDPAAVAAPAKAAGTCGACQKAAAAAAPAFPDLAAYLDHAAKTPSDFHEHVPTLKELTDRCETVAEISMWDDKPAVVAMAASAAKKVVSVSPLNKRVWDRLRPLRPDLVTAADDGPVRDGVDLLFFDMEHRAGVVRDALAKYAPVVRRYLIVHCTTDPYGETGDDGGPGVMPGVREFLRAHKEWVVKRFDEGNHGLIVMSRDAEDKVPVKFGVRDVFRYAKAKLKHALNGGRYLPLPIAEERINQCIACDKRGGTGGGNCKVCKCFLFRVPADSPVNAGGPGKVFFPAETCPVGKWHPQPTAGLEMTADDVGAMLETAFGSTE